MVSPTFLVSKPVEAKAALLLAHGAGSGMRESMLSTLSDGLTHQGWRVIRFEFPYMARQSLTGPGRSQANWQFCLTSTDLLLKL